MKIIYHPAKSFFILLLLVLINFNTSFAQTSGDSWTAVKENGSGNLNCVYSDVIGLIYKEDNLLKGTCVGILKEFSKYLKTEYDVNVTIQYTEVESCMKTFLKKVKRTPNLLGVRNTSITEKRKKYLDFSSPFLSNPAVLLTNQNSKTLNSLDSIEYKFRGYTAIAINGTTHKEYLKEIKKNHFPGLKIEYLDTQDDIFNRLKTDDKVFASVDFLVYYGAAKSNIPIKRHRVILGNKTENLGFIMRKGSDWTPILNEFLSTEFRNSSKYKQIVSENMGSSFLYYSR